MSEVEKIRSAEIEYHDKFYNRIDRLGKPIGLSTNAVTFIIRRTK